MIAKPEDISPTSNIDPSKSINPAKEQTLNQPSQSFSSYMQEGGKTQGSLKNTEELSPINLGNTPGITKGASQDSILSQINSTSSVMGDMQKQLESQKQIPNLGASKKYLLRHKLQNANTLIREAASKSGVDTGPPIDQTGRQSPISKFLGLLTDGQTQLAKAQQHIQTLNANGKQMNPGDLLTVQVKLAKAQQQTEYASVLLSTAVSDIKTLMNIQL